MKILLCFGTRPEAIKMAPVYHGLKTSDFEVKICVTAQHRQMLDQVLEFFEISPNDDLDLMRPDQSLNSLSALILEKIDAVLEREKPDLVLVHGDTTTSSMVALAAFHRGIKVGHVEAGLRTYNKLAPFPEEINRQITAKIADFHFAPTAQAAKNLLSEGILSEKIAITGNTVIEALIWAEQKIKGGYRNETIEKFKVLEGQKIVLVTGHRRESFGQGFANICEALKKVAAFENVQIVFPVHLNPNVRNIVMAQLSGIANIHLIDPVPYPAMVWLMQKATVIISDSGGMQEEAPTFGKPVLVTREISERPEGVSSGFSFLVGTDPAAIFEKAAYFLQHEFSNPNPNPYGDGHATENIVNFLQKQTIP